MPTSSGRARRSDGQRRPRRARRASPARARQRGVAVILVLMLAVAAASFVMLRALNGAASRGGGQRLVTQAALATARRALIGYAVAYADGAHSADKGPGFLPCPDRAGGGPLGAAETTLDCRSSAARETGLLPYRTLGLAELTDGSGAPLWYAVAQNFRAMATSPLNADTTSDLEVDGVGDVVAVIIAPGAALAGQRHDVAHRYSPADWLEGDNASAGDGRFTAAPAADTNDTVLTITRGELMAEVQKVVAREVAHALERYYADPDGDDDASGVDPDCAPSAPHCDDAMPWLAPAGTTTYQGVVGIGADTLARLPLLRVGQGFSAALTAGWSIASAGVYTAAGAEPPSETCLRSSTCSQPFLVGGVPLTQAFPSPVSGAVVGPWTGGTCAIDRASATSHALRLSCVADFAFTLGTRNLQRSYRFDFDSNLRIVPPGVAARRTLQVNNTNSWPGGVAATITLTDSEGGATIGTASLRFSSLDAGDIVVLRNVPFDLEALDKDKLVADRDSPGALPAWFVPNEWQASVYAQFHASLAAGYVGTPCTATGCFTLRVSRAGEAGVTDQAGVRGVVIVGGPPLAGVTPAQTRPSNVIRDYLEGDNAAANTTRFERRPATDTFNDATVELAP